MQGAVEKALERVDGAPVRVAAAGRTDSGVHATGQVISFPSDIGSIEPGRFWRALNSYLPPDVRAVESSEAPEGFSARKSARLRVYRYFLTFSRVVYPHMRRYCVWRSRRPAVSALNRLAAAAVGEHDFTAFASSRDDNPSKVRRIVSSSFHTEGAFLVYRVSADGFLRRMVRSIVGTILSLEECGCGPEAMTAIIDSRDRGRVGQTAPARGLFLDRVEYEPVTTS